MRIACSGLFVMVALVVVSPAAFAIETGVYPPALSKGAHALQFEIGYDFKLSPFQGVTLSYETFLRDQLAVRMGVGASMDHENDDHASDFQGVTESYGYEAHGDADLTNWHHQYSLVCQLVSYQRGRVAFYYGGGPKVTYSNDRSERVDFSGSEGVVYGRQRVDWRRAWGLGVCGVAGVQWLVSDRFRLHAEYSTSFMFRHENEDETVTWVRSGEHYYWMEKVTDERSSVEVSPDGTRLGLSVCF